MDLQNGSFPSTILLTVNTQVEGLYSHLYGILKWTVDIDLSTDGKTKTKSIMELYNEPMTWSIQQTVNTLEEDHFSHLSGTSKWTVDITHSTDSKYT